MQETPDNKQLLRNYSRQLHKYENLFYAYCPDDAATKWEALLNKRGISRTYQYMQVDGERSGIREYWLVVNRRTYKNLQLQARASCPEVRLMASPAPVIIPLGRGRRSNPSSIDVSVTTSGDSTLLANSDPSHAIEISYVQLSNEKASANDVTAYLKFGSSSTAYFRVAMPKGTIWNANLVNQEFIMPAATDLKINLSAAANVRGFILYRLITVA